MSNNTYVKTLFRSMIIISAVIVGGIFLSGCSGLYPELKDYQATPKTVSAQEYTYGTDAVFAAGSMSLSTEESERIVGYINRMSIGKYDRVNLMLFGNGDMTLLTSARVNAVQMVLNSQNVRLDNIIWSPEVDGMETDRVRILVDRYLVTLPGCPDWTKSARGSFDNQVHSNFGCATAMNFGAMLAEPHDLIEGRSGHTADGAYLIRSIQRYETDQTKEPEAQLTNESL